MASCRQLHQRASYPNDTGFVEYQISPTWGGNTGDVKTQRDFFRFDHSYLSNPAQAAARLPRPGSPTLHRHCTNGTSPHGFAHTSRRVTDRIARAEESDRDELACAVQLA